MTDVQSLFKRQQAHFSSNASRSLEWRLDQLARLERMVTENQADLFTALAQDFKTAWFECGMEYNAVLGTLAETRAELANWMQPEPARISQRMTDAGYKGEIHREPYGVSLIVAPFNAPLALMLNPLITALSAGNTTIVKPSETTRNVTALFQDLIGRYFEPEAVAIVSGNREVMTELLALPFDFIFFTGSTQVGKIVMRAAAEHLTPIILELGGQNPVLVDATADLEDAARKIVWGTMAFAGQWCVSPGYVYVHESVADAFVEACKSAIAAFYGSTPETSPDLSRIATEKDVDRLVGLLAGSPVVAGGTYNRGERYFAPTIVYPADWSAPIMSSEIFGPILPVMTYSDLEPVMETLKKQPRGLASYIFSSDQSTIDTYIHGFSFGGGAVNQTMAQCFISGMPFGGIGASGMGTYFGKWGFDSLSHAKSILVAPAQEISALLPPHTMEKAMTLGEWFAPAH
ncbi:aldehyde dehydrogenase family protein [Pseudomonas capsici]|uniref:aldehyde dehydrogenase family protein n=1 Tax=Pseudomonas capsici TaxID=2810614 RepID=UPI0021F204AF|nr:aldehyde dehydrogenase family protein [Pseudomonas capsici]MCV4264672.1 aldehyde dehydrogenase family protein [Pseudomonas capsici]